ncbi:hypothetical protein HDU92_002634 [Lobulomyces angularis]|nr:hypothetical protein HDU92_002634 [Lobulomyces angularis]
MFKDYLDCGKHIDSALAGVKPENLCVCDKEGSEKDSKVESTTANSYCAVQ